MSTKDIEGAQPKLFGSKKTNKPEFQNQNWDIDRSGPRALHIGLNKPEYNLGNADIEGSKPNCVKFKSQRAGTDPLNPSYQIPQVEVRPVTPPKFLRDNIGHDDIEGSKPKKATYFQTRDIMGVNDQIEGSRPRNLTHTRKAEYSNMNYTDVTHDKFKTKRSCNPLNPTYKVRDEDDKVVHIGQIDGNKPRELPVRT